MQSNRLTKLLYSYSLTFPVEIEQMLDMHKSNLIDSKSIAMDWPWGTSEPSVQMWAHESSGSGGYSDHIFKYAAKQLFDMDVAELEYKNLRNPDFREVVLERDGKLLLRFAVANGFRNIQNLVQKLKRGKSSYHYVEVMACPSGVCDSNRSIHFYSILRLMSNRFLERAHFKRCWYQRIFKHFQAV